MAGDVLNVDLSDLVAPLEKEPATKATECKDALRLRPLTFTIPSQLAIAWQYCGVHNSFFAFSALQSYRSY